MGRYPDISREEYMERLDKYASEIKNIDKKTAMEILIRTGVLDSDGNPKEQICTGGMLEL